MKMLAFLAILGGTDAGASALGASYGQAAGIAWGVALLCWLVFFYARRVW